METIKNLVVIVVPLATLLIAWRGLSTWNRQLIGARNSDLSKRLLVALYNIEEMIHDIRSPFVEYSLPEGVQPYDEEANNKAWADHIEAKFRKLGEQLVQLHAAGIEAKAVWDKSFMKSLTPIWRISNRLRSRWKENVRSKLDPNFRPIFEPEETRKIVYGLEDDEFGQAVKQAVQEIEDAVRSQIRA